MMMTMKKEMKNSINFINMEKEKWTKGLTVYAGPIGWAFVIALALSKQSYSWLMTKIRKR